MLETEQERRLLNLHLRRKSNDEKKHWLPLRRPQAQVFKEEKSKTIADNGALEIRYDQEKLERMLL